MKPEVITLWASGRPAALPHSADFKGYPKLALAKEGGAFRIHVRPTAW